ncbi:MAG: AMP-binding protein [Thiolinea sp.]
MSPQNHLLHTLRTGSQGRQQALFARLPEQGSTLSFAELFAGAEQLAAALSKAGIAPGDRVAVQVDKSIQAVQLYLATLMAGAVFLPLNTAYTATEVRYFLGDAEPALLVCDPAKQDTLQAVADACGVRHCWTLGADGSGSLSAYAQQHGPGFEPVARSADDLAAILYTSGTTGRSKGAMLTHGNLASNAEVLQHYWQFTADDVLIHALPIFHVHGLFTALNTVLVAGASLIFLPQFDAAAITRHLPEATTLMGVPTFYVRLLEQPGLAEAARNMRLFISGSAPLLLDTHQRWQQQTGHAILERYGMTETGMNTSNPYQGERRAGTVGLPLPGTEVRITDPQTGTPLTTGETGMIEVRGPNVFKGYWRMPEKRRKNCVLMVFLLPVTWAIWMRRAI